MVGIILPNKHKIIISRKFQSKKGRIDGGGGLKMPIFAGRPLWPLLQFVCVTHCNSNGTLQLTSKAYDVATNPSDSSAN